MIMILSERPTLNSSSSIRANTQIMSMCVILLIIVIVSDTPTCLPFRYIPARNQFRYMFTLSILNIHSSTYQNKLYIMISPKLKWKSNRVFCTNMMNERYFYRRFFQILLCEFVECTDEYNCLFRLLFVSFYFVDFFYSDL